MSAHRMAGNTKIYAIVRKSNNCNHLNLKELDCGINIAYCGNYPSGCQHDYSSYFQVYHFLFSQSTQLFKESICIGITDGNVLITYSNPVFFDVVDFVQSNHIRAVDTQKLLRRQ